MERLSFCEPERSSESLVLPSRSITNSKTPPNLHHPDRLGLLLLHSQVCVLPELGSALLPGFSQKECAAAVFGEGGFRSCLRLTTSFSHCRESFRCGWTCFPSRLARLDHRLMSPHEELRGEIFLSRTCAHARAHSHTCLHRCFPIGA